MVAVLVDGTLIQSSVSIDLLDILKSFLADLSKDSRTTPSKLLRISLLVGMVICGSRHQDRSFTKSLFYSERLTADSYKLFFQYA